MYLFIELTLDTACTLGLGRETLASVASGAGGDPRKAEIEAQPPAPSPEVETLIPWQLTLVRREQFGAEKGLKDKKQVRFLSWVKANDSHSEEKLRNKL